MKANFYTAIKTSIGRFSIYKNGNFQWNYVFRENVNEEHINYFLQELEVENYEEVLELLKNEFWNPKEFEEDDNLLDYFDEELDWGVSEASKFVLREWEEIFFDKFDIDEAKKVIAVVRTIQDSWLKDEINLETFKKYVEVWEEETITTVFSNTNHKFYVYEDFEKEEFYAFKVKEMNDEEIVEKSNEKEVNYYKSSRDNPCFQIIYAFNWDSSFPSVQQTIEWNMSFDQYNVYLEEI